MKVSNKKIKVSCDIWHKIFIDYVIEMSSKWLTFGTGKNVFTLNLNTFRYNFNYTCINQLATLNVIEAKFLEKVLKKFLKEENIIY